MHTCAVLMSATPAAYHTFQHGRHRCHALHAHPSLALPATESTTQSAHVNEEACHPVPQGAAARVLDPKPELLLLQKHAIRSLRALLLIPLFWAAFADGVPRPAEVQAAWAAILKLLVCFCVFCAVQVSV